MKYSSDIIQAFDILDSACNMMFLKGVAVHLGVKMADTLSFTTKVNMVDF